MALLVALVGTGCGPEEPAIGSRDNLVRIESGWVVGVPGGDPAVYLFKGIPYAAPPVGELRWRAPQPVIPWKGVRKADTFGASCIQFRQDPTSIFYDDPHPISEDCLYLNVWSAARSPRDRRPVLLWIHDGGFLWGEGTRAVADGETLSKKGAVVVTINYRLGVFGFLAHSELSRESGHGVSGNYGLLDMIGAIQWTKRNIAAFGGDPERITILGESSGSRAVSALYASPLVKGDLHGAIAEDSLFAGFLLGPKLADAEHTGAEFAKTVGASSIAELRQMSPERLFPPSFAEVVAQGYFFGPVIDRWVLPDDVLAIEERGAPQGIPVLTGSTADFATPLVGAISAAAFVEQVRKTYGERAEQFLRLYPATSDAEAAASQMSALSDQMAWMHNEWAALHARNGHRAYLYFFTHAPPIPPNARQNLTGGALPQRLGAYHTGEIGYTFDSLAKLNRAWTPSDRKLADIMSSYWVNFAASGDPNGPGLPRWPAYADVPEPVMELGDEVRPIQPVLGKAKSDFWTGYFAARAHERH
jgi:para-nitrobenzyl esterase